MIYSTKYSSPTGELTLAASGQALIGLWTEGQKHFGKAIIDEAVDRSDLPIFYEVKSWLDRYFASEQPPISELSLAPNGSEFRQAVWKILCETPYGQVTTYGDIAKQIAGQMGKSTMSAQAVGGAVGHNPISIIIPCHRVIGANGNLTGYAGGIDMKLWLLRHERAPIDNL